VKPEEVSVEAFYGPIDGQRRVTDGQTAPLTTVDGDGRGAYTFSGEIPLTGSGMLGYGVRIVPRHPDLPDPYEMRLIRWS
jgi:starch phosphorylase